MGKYLYLGSGFLIVRSILDESLVQTTMIVLDDAIMHDSFRFGVLFLYWPECLRLGLWDKLDVLSAFVVCYTWWQPVMTRPSESDCRGCCRPISRCYTRQWSGSVVTSVGMFVSVQAFAARLTLWEGGKTCLRGVYGSVTQQLIGKVEAR